MYRKAWAVVGGLLWACGGSVSQQGAALAPRLPVYDVVQIRQPVVDVSAGVASAKANETVENDATALARLHVRGSIRLPRTHGEFGLSLEAGTLHSDSYIGGGDASDAPSGPVFGISGNLRTRVLERGKFALGLATDAGLLSLPFRAGGGATERSLKPVVRFAAMPAYDVGPATLHLAVGLMTGNQVRSSTTPGSDPGPYTTVSIGFGAGAAVAVSDRVELAGRLSATGGNGVAFTQADVGVSVKLGDIE